jgi:hypothetical protein
MEMLSDGDSLPDIVVTDDEVNHTDQSDEEINLSESTRLGNPFSNLHLEGFNNILFPRVSHNQQIGVNGQLEENKEGDRSIADWMRIGQRIVDRRSELASITSENDSDTTIELAQHPISIDYTSRFEYKNINAGTVRNLLECKI